MSPNLNKISSNTGLWLVSYSKYCSLIGPGTQFKNKNIKKLLHYFRELLHYFKKLLHYFKKLYIYIHQDISCDLKVYIPLVTDKRCLLPYFIIL